GGGLPGRARAGVPVAVVRVAVPARTRGGRRGALGCRSRGPWLRPRPVPAGAARRRSEHGHGRRSGASGRSRQARRHAPPRGRRPPPLRGSAGRGPVDSAAGAGGGLRPGPAVGSARAAGRGARRPARAPPADRRRRRAIRGDRLDRRMPRAPRDRPAALLGLPAARAASHDAAGPPDDDDLIRARVLAVSLWAALAEYAHDVGMPALLSEVLAGLGRATEDLR